MGSLRVVAFTAAALVSFAANSILSRLALRQGAIDPATFTTIRLVSGAIVLWTIASMQKSDVRGSGSWTSAGLLALYAVPFSLAYVSLTVGTGALILFGGVQVTMLIGAILSGERAAGMQWVGIGSAVAGLITLVLPGLAAPPLRAAGLMTTAGVAWGLYSLRGRKTSNPLAETTGNFIRAAPVAVGVSAAMLPQFHIGLQGALYAVASGAIASGLGYVAWYAALRRLARLQAAIVQLAVPILSSLGGVVFLSETMSTRLIAASLLVVGGIALANLRK